MRQEFYHRLYLADVGLDTLYITKEGHEIHDPSFLQIGHSKQLPWLEKLLKKTQMLPIEQVFYLLDIQKMNEEFSSEAMRDWMNADIGIISPGTYCKLREVHFEKSARIPPKLVLFHDYLNQDESNFFLRDYIKYFDWSRYVGRMTAITCPVKTAELVPTPLPVEEKFDVDKEMKEVRERFSNPTLGDILGPLLKKANKEDLKYPPMII